MNLPHTVKSHSSEETRQAGKELGGWLISRGLKNPIVLLLSGSMGAGKTEFTKGVAEGLGIAEAVLSPTFTLAREYPFFCGGVSSLLIHADLWRLDSEEELKDVRLEALRKTQGVAVVEWSERFPDGLFKQLKDLHPFLVQVHLAFGETPDERTITMVHG